MIRIGHGFDVHKFGGEGPLTICGEKIDYPQGFLAHSDGDVAIHALCALNLLQFLVNSISPRERGFDENYIPHFPSVTRSIY